MSRLMGIDYGTKRVGIALSDDEGRVAFPKAVLQNSKTLMRDVATLIRDHGVTEVVVGESHDNRGVDNPIAPAIRRFAGDLEREVDVTIHFEPEYYSSQEARAHTGEALVDAAAAAILLNSFLTKRHPPTPQTP